jgi:hypothetical protein
MKIFVFSLKIGLAAATSHKILLTEAILMYHEVFLWKLTFAVLASQFGFVT